MLGAIVQTAGSCRYSLVMSTLMHRLYRCPNTRARVQSYGCIKTADGAYEDVTCNICRGVHLVDRATGRVVGKDKDVKGSEMARARPRLTLVVRNSRSMPRRLGAGTDSALPRKTWHLTASVRHISLSDIRLDARTCDDCNYRRKSHVRSARMARTLGNRA